MSVTAYPPGSGGAGGGEVNTASNVSTSPNLFKQKTGVDLEFKSIGAASNKLTTATGADDVTFDIAEGNLTLDSLGGTLGIAKGGTGQTAQTAAFDALAPTTTDGDLVYFDGSDNVRQAIGSSGQVFEVSGAGGTPVWRTQNRPFSMVLESPDGDEEIPLMFLDEAHTITQLNAAVSGDSVGIGWNLGETTSLSATGTAVLAATQTTITTGAGDEITSFDNASLAAGTWLMYRSVAATGSPGKFVLTVTMNRDGA